MNDGCECLTSLLTALRAVGATNMAFTSCSLRILKYTPGSGVPTGFPYKLEFYVYLC